MVGLKAGSTCVGGQLSFSKDTELLTTQGSCHCCLRKHTNHLCSTHPIRHLGVFFSKRKKRQILKLNPIKTWMMWSVSNMFCIIYVPFLSKLYTLMNSLPTANSRINSDSASKCLKSYFSSFDFSFLTWGYGIYYMYGQHGWDHNHVIGYISFQSNYMQLIRG